MDEYPVVRHLLLSLEASYDFAAPATPYSLGHLAFKLRPPVGSGYPFWMTELWLFAHLEGEGEHELWAEVFCLTESEEEPSAAYGPFVVRFGTEYRQLSRCWHLRGVPFLTPGWHQFRLSCGGQVLATEHVYLEE